MISKSKEPVPVTSNANLVCPIEKQAKAKDIKTSKNTHKQKTHQQNT